MNKYCIVSKSNDYSISELLAQAESGDRDAQAYLGFRYQKGMGVKKNYPEALRWYRKVSEQGAAKVQYNLAMMLKKGLGEKSITEAIYWLEKSAEKGFPVAQTKLGVMYLDGDGVKRDLNKAVMLFLKAAEQGNGGAQLNLGMAFWAGVGIMQDTVMSYIWLSLGIKYGPKHLRHRIVRTLAKMKMTKTQIVQADEWIKRWEGSKK